MTARRRAPWPRSSVVRTRYGTQSSSPCQGSSCWSLPGASRVAVAEDTGDEARRSQWTTIQRPLPPLRNTYPRPLPGLRPRTRAPPSTSRYSRFTRCSHLRVHRCPCPPVRAGRAWPVQARRSTTSEDRPGRCQVRLSRSTAAVASSTVGIRTIAHNRT